MNFYNKGEIEKSLLVVFFFVQWREALRSLMFAVPLYLHLSRLLGVCV